MQDVGISDIKEPNEFICIHCFDGRLYLTLAQINLHIRQKHSLEKELTHEQARSDGFERKMDPDNLDEQDVPDRIKKYFHKLRLKNKNNH